MIKQEAEKEVKELNAVDPKWFCPSINAMCRKDCINFIPAYVEEIEQKTGILHDINDDNFYVTGFACSNASFIGSMPFQCTGDK